MDSAEEETVLPPKAYLTAPTHSPEHSLTQTQETLVIGSGKSHALLWLQQSLEKQEADLCAPRMRWEGVLPGEGLPHGGNQIKHID